MIGKLGVTGVVGFLMLCGGIAVLAYADPLVAAGVAFVVAGLGLVVRGLLGSALQAMGMGGML
jgi:uncharacterized membrane protein YjjP (DUF1212 family)